jgi:PhoD-like phosphatase
VPELRARDGLDADEPATLTRRRFLAAGAAAGVGLPSLFRAGRAYAFSSTPLPVLAATTLDGGGLLAAVRTTGPAEVRLRAWPVGDPSVSQRTRWYPTNDADVAKLSLPSAGTPGRAWAWRAEVRDPMSPLLAPARDVIRRIPARPAPGEPSTFTFAFGCCTVRALGKAFRHVRQARPQFFAMIGDLGYPDRPSEWFPIAQTYHGYLQAFADILQQPQMTPILSSMPFFVVQDDHDYGSDDCDRTTVRPFAGRAFADLMPGGAYPEPNYRSWSVGDADFFLTDNRRWKDPEMGPFQNGRYMSVLGSRQRQWLLRRLAASTAKLKCVFIPMTMAWYWSGAEGKEVRDFISDNVSGTVIFLSGDKHASAFARYTPRIWEFLAAPICNPVKHTTPLRSSAVNWTENGVGTALENAFGLVDVDTLHTDTCTLRLMREDGVEMHREVVALAD